MSAQTADRQVVLERHGEVGFESAPGVIHWEESHNPGIALCGARLRGDYQDATGKLVECVVCIELNGGRP